MSQRVRRAALGVAAVAGAAMLGTTVIGNASASGAVRGDACGPKACGSATMVFVGSKEIHDISYSVSKKICNVPNAYLDLKIWYTDGTYAYADHLEDSSCDGTYESAHDQVFYGSKTIKGVNVFVGIKGGESPKSAWIDNPNV
jgi:hypothetical protein